MKTMVNCYSNSNSQASFGRQFSHADFSSVILSSDVGIATSVFVVIAILSRIIRFFTINTGYAYVSS